MSRNSGSHSDRSSSSWVNIACVVGGVILGATWALISGPARSDDAELRAQLAAVEQRLAALDARLASRASVPAASMDAAQLREIVRSALAERDGRVGASAAASDVGSARPAPETRSDRAGYAADQEAVRSALERGDPEEMMSVVREVVRSLNE